MLFFLLLGLLSLGCAVLIARELRSYSRGIWLTARNLGYSRSREVLYQSNLRQGWMTWHRLTFEVTLRLGVSEAPFQVTHSSGSPWTRRYRKLETFEVFAVYDESMTVVKQFLLKEELRTPFQEGLCILIGCISLLTAAGCILFR